MQNNWIQQFNHYFLYAKYKILFPFDSRVKYHLDRYVLDMFREILLNKPYSVDILRTSSGQNKNLPMTQHIAILEFCTWFQPLDTLEFKRFYIYHILKLWPVASVNQKCIWGGRWITVKTGNITGKLVKWISGREEKARDIAGTRVLENVRKREREKERAEPELQGW